MPPMGRREGFGDHELEEAIAGFQSSLDIIATEYADQGITQEELDRIAMRIQQSEYETPEALLTGMSILAREPVGKG